MSNERIEAIKLKYAVTRGFSGSDMVDEKEQEILDLLDHIDNLESALGSFIMQASPEPEGKMSGMANSDKRYEWYDQMKVIVSQARKALNK